jgi:hypothetical protein
MLKPTETEPFADPWQSLLFQNRRLSRTACPYRLGSKPALSLNSQGGFRNEHEDYAEVRRHPLLAAGTAAAQTLAGGGSIGVTAFDNVRLSLVNTAPNPTAPSCTVTASLANVTPGAAASTTVTAAPTGDCPIGDCFHAAGADPSAVHGLGSLRLRS